jgi:methionyl-tRNA formyltransferase
VAIGPEETAGELRARLVEVGTEVLLANLDRVPDTEPVTQEGEPTYAHKLTVEEFELDWARPAAELARLVRAGNPRPGAWTTASGRRLKVRRARPEEVAAAAPGTLVGPAQVATGEGVLHLVEVQPEDKAPMAGTAWAAGFRGDHLGKE